MFYVRCTVMACLTLLACQANAFIDPPVIAPLSPTDETPVSVEVRNGLCDRIFDYTITSPVNPVEVILHRIPTQQDPLCINPIQTAVVPLGVLPAGTHQVRLLFQIRESMGSPPSPPFLWQELSVTVAPSGTLEPVAVPVVSGRLVLLVLLVLVALTARGRLPSRTASFMAAAGVFAATGLLPAPASAAIHVEVLISSDSAAPTPEQIVDWGFSTPPVGTPPLPALAVEPFLAIDFFIPERFRAKGDFKAILDEYPDSPQALLERFIVVTYPDNANLQKVLDAFAEDSFAVAAAVMETYDFDAVTLESYGFKDPSSSQADQWHLTLHKVPQAWQHNPGHALIAFVDSGLQWNHPNLRAFNGSTFLGGNYLTVGSYDLVYPPAMGDIFPDDDVDERKPIPATHSACDMGNGMMVPSGAGHGTHASGIATARSTFAGDIIGVCKHCGLYMMKATEHECNVFANPPEVMTFLAANHLFASVQVPIRIGAQIVNMSFSAPASYICQNPTHALRSSCLVLEIAHSRDTIVVASSGNDRTALFFPAADPRVVAVGGVAANGTFWDESPGSTTNCPVIPGLPIGGECGSNYTTIGGGPKQELAAGARDVISTFYTGATWNSYVRCTDDANDIGTPNDGISPCTGTSMSAPIVSGILGLMRSSNPLVRTGDPEQVGVLGLRNVLASTTDRAQAGQAWDQRLGYGRPDATAAVRRVLGRVAGVPVKNRATPLFGLYGINAEDYVHTTSPQKAVAFAMNQAANYNQAVGTLVPGYPAFPPDPEAPLPPTPRAVAYVMTTPNKPAASTPDLVPIHLMEISRNWPLGCGGGGGCNTLNRDFLLVTDVSDLQTLKAAGYEYYGREGYIYQRCTPEPACIPHGAEKLWRKCKTADDDCAVFLESDRLTYEANGYTATVPPGSNPTLGYAYPAMDTDGDGLIDGFEYLIGTDPLLSDTDGDGISDGVEFPLAAISTSDPCDGPMAWRCPADRIFANGFQ